MTLVAWYKLNGNAEDSSGNNFHGIVSNVSWADGKIGQGASFSGNGYIKNDDINLGSDNFSFALWVETSSLDNINSSVGFIEEASGNGCIFYPSTTYGLANNQIRFWALGGEVLIGPDIRNTGFRHLCVTRKGNLFKLYVDGAFYSQGSRAGSFANGITIGNSYGMARPFTGVLDDVRIYDHALSPKEVRLLSQAKILHYKLSDYQMNEGSILNFTGGDYVEINEGLIPRNSDFTLEVTFSLDNVVDGSDPVVIGTGSTSSERIYLYSSTTFGSANNQLRFWCSGIGELLIGSDLRGQGFVHVSIVRSGNNWYLYEDGVEVDSTTNSGTLRSHSTVEIGGGSPDSRWHRGEVKDFRIWNVARTQQQIQDNMHKQLMGSESGLIAYYDFYGEGPILPDRTGDNDGVIIGATWENGGDIFVPDVSEESQYTIDEEPTAAPPLFKIDSIRGGHLEFIGGQTIETNLYPSDSLFNTGEFTWSFWNLWSRFASDIGSHGSAGSSPRFYCQLTSTSGDFRTAIGSDFATTMRIPQTDVWYHIAITFKDGNVKTYLNGDLKNIQTDIDFSGTSSTPFILGAGFGGARRHEGKTSDMRLYKKALTDDEIKNIYKSRASIDNIGNVYTNEFDTYNDPKNSFTKKGIVSFADIDEVSGTSNGQAAQITKNGKLIINGEFNEVD